LYDNKVYVIVITLVLLLMTTVLLLPRTVKNQPCLIIILPLLG